MGGLPSGVSVPPILQTKKMKNEDVHLVLPVLVGLEQGPDQQQGGADGTNQVCGKRAEGKQRGVRGRRANEIAGEPDPAGNDKQRKHHAG